MDKELEATIHRLIDSRQGASICPSEAARAVFDENWCERMPEVRKVARKMAASGQVEICQKGIVVDPATVKGPIRIRKPGN